MPSFATRLSAVNPEVGQIQTVIEIDIPDASQDNDFIVPYACRVVSAHMLATGIAAHATADTWQVKNGANAITDAVAKTATVNAKSNAATFNPTYTDLVAGATLRVTGVHNTNVAGKVFVSVVRTDLAGY